MWISLVIQGAIACAVLIWYGLQSWPAHLAGALAAVPLPAILIAAGVLLRQRERKLKPHEENYLASNASEARELKRARIIKWIAFASVLFAIVVIARSMPTHYEGSTTAAYAVAGILLIAILGPLLYEAAVRAKIEHGAIRQSLAARPPPTPQGKRNAVIRMISLFILLIGVVIVDQVFDPPISAFNLLVVGVLVLMAVEFIWRKMNPPSDRD